MRYTLLLTIILISLSDLAAQTVFRPGYVITNSMDTLIGLVDYRGDVRNMKFCVFKENENSTPSKFYPEDIQGYRFNDGKFFVSKYIHTKNLQDTVFVEFLLKGITNLYYYASANYSAYFLETETSDLIELRKNEIKIEKDGRIYYKQDKKYVGLLNYTLADCPEIMNEVNKTSLNHKSMIQITKRYHDYKCTDEVCVVYEKKLPVLQVEIKPLIGYSMSKLSFSGFIVEKVDFQASFSPFIGAAFNFVFPGLNKKFSLQANIAVNEDYFYGSLINESASYYYHLKSININKGLALKYTYPKGKIRPDIFAGIHLNSKLKSENKLYSEYVTGETTLTNPSFYDGHHLGFYGGVGIEYALFKKLRSFCNFSFQNSAQTLEVYGKRSEMVTYSMTTGLIF